jgi:hypothetical protein
VFQAGEQLPRGHLPRTAHRIRERGTQQIERVADGQDVVQLRALTDETVVVHRGQRPAVLGHQPGTRVLEGGQPLDVLIGRQLLGGRAQQQAGDLHDVAVRPHGGRRSGAVDVPVPVPAPGEEAGGLGPDRVGEAGQAALPALRALRGGGPGVPPVAQRPRRVPGGHRPRGQIPGDHRPGTDHAVVADRHPVHHDHVRADPHVVPDGDPPAGQRLLEDRPVRRHGVVEAEQ